MGEALSPGRCPGLGERLPLRGGLLPFLGLVLAAWTCSAASAQHSPPCPTVQLGVPIFSRPTGRPDLRVADDVLAKAPREAQEQLGQARQAAAEGRYREAAAGLQALLDRDDGFLPAEGAAPRSGLRTIRQEATRILGTMPAEGRQSYETQFGAQARAVLDEAVSRRDQQSLARVAETWFPTRAGSEATILLARDALDRGSPREAIFRLGRVRQSPDAAQHEPECSLLTAVGWLLLGDEGQARQALAEVAQRAPQATFRLGSREFAPRAGNEALACIKEQLHPKPIGPGASAERWTMFRGNAARNAQAAWNGVLGAPRWRVQTVEDPDDLRLLRSVHERAWAEPTARVPVVHPLVVGGLVVTRTPWRVLALDAATGQPRWEHPPRTTPQTPSPLAGEGRGEGAGAAPRGQTRDRAGPFGAADLLERVSEDAAFGQLASDGRRVFFVDAIETNPRAKPAGPASPLAAFIDPSDLPNRLVALDLAEGRLAWAVGGEKGEAEPKLAGAFFLGAPLPDASRLYVLAEIKGLIALLGLDAATGRLEWSRAIAHPRDGVLQDPVRRLSGAAPSLADGVIVCPTSAGVVVAVDAATRSILWGYAYRRTDPLAPPPAPAAPGAPLPPESQWTDAAATIAEGRVLVTPFDSDQLHCLDLFTGKPLWVADARSMLFVACVHEGNAILVGLHEVSALCVASGKPAWRPPATPLPGKALPSGRGLWADGHCDLPTTGRQIVRIDLSTGRIAATIDTEEILGNLAAGGGWLVSQSAEKMVAFESPIRPRRRNSAPATR